MEASEFVIDFQKVKKAYYKFIKQEVSDIVAERYYKYLDEYLKEPISHPSQLAEIIDVVKQETRGGKLRWVSASISSLLKFYEERLNIPREWTEPFRRVLRWEKSNPREVFINDEELVDAYEVVKEKSEDARIVFELLVYSGIRLEHAVRMLNEYEAEKLVVLEDKGIARYPINFASRGKKKGYWAYMPLDFANRLNKRTIDYRIKDKILHGKVSANTIRKWHANFLILNKVPESVVEFIQGRANVTVGSVHYYQKTKLADEFYPQVVDKFPIKED